MTSITDVNVSIPVSPGDTAPVAQREQSREGSEEAKISQIATEVLNEAVTEVMETLEASRLLEAAEEKSFELSDIDEADFEPCALNLNRELGYNEQAGKGVYWTTDPSVSLPIRVGSTYPANLKARTITEVFNTTVGSFPNKAAHKFEVNGEWRIVTWLQYSEHVKQFAKSLIHLGVESHKGVAIQGFNSHEWMVANIGAIFANAIPAGIYATNNPEACKHVAAHCSARVIVLEDEEQLKKYDGLRDDLSAVKCFVVWNATVNTWNDPKVKTWNEFMRLGENVPDAALNERIAAQNPGSCSSLIYTSGTTGLPKAVMMSHDNLTWVTNVIGDQFKMGQDDEMVSYLPLSHVAAQLVDMYGPITYGSTVSFAQPTALKGTLVKTLQAVRPTLFLGVPRVWEKIEETMTNKGKEVVEELQGSWSGRNIKLPLLRWSKRKGVQTSIARQNGSRKPRGWKIANKILFSKVKGALGFDRVRLTFAGAAPISEKTQNFFAERDITILDIYGMSESAGPQTMCRLGDYKVGSCGKSFDGSELMFDGVHQLKFRGRHIFMGYMHNEESTREMFDANGFIASGDLGKVDDKGNVFITGRKKELIITAGGENVAPVLIENNIKAAISFVSNAVVVGDKQKFLGCLITLPTDLNEDGSPTVSLTEAVRKELRKAGSNAMTTLDAKDDPVVKLLLKDGIKTANLKAISKAQRVSEFVILERDFSINDDTLTSTMKLKRPVVQRLYANEIQGLYGDHWRV
ncbi:MAG: long-chain-fatty-acid--CoA ligase ACSBG [Chlamydiales bacterium]|jgi:long-chain-fatty-acid--CoA ligase ACSBG